MAKMTIDKLAEMTQEQFSHIDERLDGMDEKLNDLKTGQERILEVVLEIPSKKAFERFETRAEARFTALEKKAGI